MVFTAWTTVLQIIFVVNSIFAEPLTTRVLDYHGHHMKVVSEETFSHHIGVTHLILSNCSVSYISPRAFCSLQSLRVIDLSDNDILFIDPVTFVCTPNLKRLYLSDNVNLGTDSHNPFLRSNSITYLDIRNCGFYSFSSNTFITLKNLKTVFASDNPACLPLRQTKWSMRNIQCGEKDIHFSSPEKSPISSLPYPDNATEIRIQNISLTVIPERFFENQNLSHLQVLNMSDLNITFVHPRAFCGLNSLRSLDLSRNDLQYINPETFHCIPYLKNLVLSNNQRLGFGPHRTFLYSNSIENLYISNCGFVSYSEEMFSSVKHLTYIDVSGNVICPKVAKELLHVGLANCSETLADDISSNIYVNITLISESFFSDPKWMDVTRLDLSHTNVTNIEHRAFCLLPYLIELDLSGNLLQYLHPDTFMCNSVLENLYLADNKNLHCGPIDIFLYSKSLKYLDIGNCNFNAFTDIMFSELNNLIFINAVGNPSCSQTTEHLRDISNVPCTDIFDDKVNAYELPEETGVTERDHRRSATPVEGLLSETPTAEWIPELGGGIMSLLLIATSVINVILVLILMVIAIWYVRLKVVYREPTMKEPLLETP